MNKSLIQKHSHSIIGIISIVTLLIVFISQYGWGLIPCQLCIWQRVPFVILIGLTGVYYFPVRSKHQHIYHASILFCMSFILAMSVVLSGFHVGVEQHWWQGLSSCKTSIPYNLSMDDLRIALLETPPMPCDQVQWSFVGISMAGYNFLLSGILMIFSLFSGFKCLTRP
jgi:disulfide bond formation protein DsbB